MQQLINFYRRMSFIFDFKMSASAAEDNICEIQTDEGIKFHLKLQNPRKFYELIVGGEKQNNYRKQFQQETNTAILVPRTGPADKSIIIIQGASKGDVVAAKNRIDLIVKGPPQFTHFLSVSCATEEIKSSFLRFKREVLEDNGTSQDLASLFQKPEKLHFTITLLVLPNEQDRVIALECLEECKSLIVDKFLRDEPLQVTIDSLGCMNNNPRACNVLYANVVSEKMQEVADEIKQYFERRGIIKLDEGNVKLHVTLMNTKFSSRRRRQTIFDATRILEKFRNFYFGSFTVNEIHLGKLRTKSANGYYESAGSITLG